MRRATITIPDELQSDLERYLDGRDAPPSLTVLVQSALREYLANRGHGPAPRGLALTPSETGSGRSDISVEHDRAIAER